jgi:hypothetical protein
MSAACRRTAAGRRLRAGRALRVAFGLCATLGLCATVGCRLQGAIVPAPWTFAEQRAAILELAPLGTPRDEAIARWKDAGIDGTFGTNDSIWYCDAWRRPDGQTWELSVAMLFDEQGRLYETRVADADTGVVRPTVGKSAPAEQSP